MTATADQDRDRSAEGATAGKLLDRGRALYRRLRVADLLPGVRGVCREADMPTGSFYWAFRNTANFSRRLIGSIVAADPSMEIAQESEALFTQVDDWWPQPPPAGADKSAVIGQLVCAAFEQFCDTADGAFRSQLLLTGASIGDDGPLADAVRRDYRALYDDATDCYERGYQVILDAWGLELREPLALRSLVVTVAAMFDGLLLRLSVDPDLDATTIVEDAVRLIIAASFSCGEKKVDDLDAFVTNQLSVAS